MNSHPKTIIDTNIMILATLGHLKPDISSKEKRGCIVYDELLSSGQAFHINNILLEFENVFHKVVLRKYKYYEDELIFVNNSFQKLLSKLTKDAFIYPLLTQDFELARDIYNEVNKNEYKISLIDSTLIAVSMNLEKLPIFTFDKKLVEVAKSYGIVVVE